MAFDAKAELRKHGWKEGRGLGKKEDGIKERIKVNIKKSRSGIGHNVGDEFSYHWWDHMFNEAANNIHVTNAENCVKFDVTNDNLQLNKHKRHSSEQTKKHHLYRNFIKSATLTCDKDTVREVPDTLNDTQHRVDLSPPTSSLDEDLLNRCSGLTGHRAARHGHQLNGKLSRLAQQEASHTSTQTSDMSSTVSSTAVVRGCQISDMSSTVSSTAAVQDCQRKHSKTKKKKKKKKSLKRTGTEES